MRGAFPDPRDETLVRFRNVQKSYDGRTVVVRNLQFDVRRGEFLTLLGPYGSEKTTTLMMLAGLKPVTRGAIELKGRALSAMHDKRSHHRQA
jgi:putative spermidine/putrescine transport system ATP-binding protein